MSSKEKPTARIDLLTETLRHHQATKNKPTKKSKLKDPIELTYNTNKQLLQLGATNMTDDTDDYEEDDDNDEYNNHNNGYDDDDAADDDDDADDRDKNPHDKQDYDKEIENDYQTLKAFQLPGGKATIKANKTKTTPAIIGEVDDKVTLLIRDYMDVLFSSVMMAALLCPENHPEQIIPAVVDAILKYNNIEFSLIRLKIVPGLHEPIWYTYNITSGILVLYFDQNLFTQFAAKINDNPVSFSGGIIPLNRFDPYSQHEDLPRIEQSMINYALACDHVAQHIIVDVLNEPTNHQLGVHDNFRIIGTTLHSIFDVSQNMQYNPRCDFNPTNYFSYNVSATMALPSAPSSSLVPSSQNVQTAMFTQTTNAPSTYNNMMNHLFNNGSRL
jgi:hypothetical protein